MTTEEIIHGLSFLRDTVESDEDFEIFDTAIKAIEAINKIKMLLDMDNEQHTKSIKLSELKEVLGLCQGNVKNVQSGNILTDMDMGATMDKL